MDYLIIEKIYFMNSIRRKDFEEDKAGVIDIDDEIAKVEELDSMA